MDSRTTRRFTLIAGLAMWALAGCGRQQPAEPPAQPAAAAPAPVEQPDAALKAVKDKGVLVVGVAPFYAPFESTNEKTKEIEGFDVDLVRAIAAKMGLGVKHKPAEWQALLGGLDKGDHDLIFSAMSKKEAAAANVEFSDVYYHLDDIIITAKGNPKSIQGKADLKDKVVGVQLGSGSEPLADGIKGEVGIKEVKKYKLTQDAMNDLKAGRIDGVIAGYTFAVEQTRQDPSFVVLAAPLASAELVGVFRKGSGSLVAEFNKALAAVKADGTYDQLVAKWLALGK
ncbi:MAG: amino acid ABC transporter substrate-binding protein [Rubrivivax sp.]|jgi:polar amino acid transport system substrate-binding protein|nr:amino acid ABC transporter substrate-binding protein [Rubrivivax sp.]